MVGMDVIGNEVGDWVVGQQLGKIDGECVLGGLEGDFVGFAGWFVGTSDGSSVGGYEGLGDDR